jgi:hypothetical protein
VGARPQRSGTSRRQDEDGKQQGNQATEDDHARGLRRRALLFKGDDFTHTDITLAR